MVRKSPSLLVMRGLRAAKTASGASSAPPKGLSAPLAVGEAGEGCVLPGEGTSSPTEGS